MKKACLICFVSLYGALTPAASAFPFGKSKTAAKISSEVSALVKAWRQCGQRCLQDQSGKYEADIRKDQIRLRITAHSEADVAALKDWLTRNGGAEMDTFQETVFVWLEARRVDKAAHSPLVDRIALSGGNSKPAHAGSISQ